MLHLLNTVKTVTLMNYFKISIFLQKLFLRGKKKLKIDNKKCFLNIKSAY